MNYENLREEYLKLWDSCIVRPSVESEVKRICDRILQNKDRYQSVSQDKIPWQMIACIHNMESSMNWATCLHNGQPWNQKTTIVPIGKGPWRSWEEAAKDALNGYYSVASWTIDKVLYYLEGYNGWGYRRHGINTPYLWSGTDKYLKGKYVADGKYDPDAVSKQIGCVPILKSIYIIKCDKCGAILK